MTWGLARGFFYVWFSFTAGLIADLVMIRALGGGAGLPAGGVPLVVFAPLLILGSLVSTQWGHFGQPVSLLRWIPVCVVLTIALLLASALGL